MTSSDNNDRSNNHNNLVSIKATYFLVQDINTTTANEDDDAASSTITTTSCQTFDASNTKEAHMGLHENNTTTPPTKPQPGDTDYSGMHDQGPLLQLKEGGPLAILLGCSTKAKEYNNSFLTERIQREKTNAQNNGQTAATTASSSCKKKAKVEE